MGKSNPETRVGTVAQEGSTEPKSNGAHAAVAQSAVLTATSEKSSKKRRKARRKKNAEGTEIRKRGRKSYPVVPFSDVLPLPEAIMKQASGQPVKRVTLLKMMGLEVTAQSTRHLITNSNKYGATHGSHSADMLKLSTTGALAVNERISARERGQARFDLSVAGVSEFARLFEKRKGSNMPAPEVLHDDLIKLDSGDRKQCADVFTSNVKFLGLMTPRDGAQYLMTLEEWIANMPTGSGGVPSGVQSASSGVPANIEDGKTDFDKVCFVISTIKEPGHNERDHADVILNQYIERALNGTGLKAVRADKIGDPGMISKQTVEYIIKAKLVIADLSFHNPNVYYELCLRHVTGKPTVHLIQESDKIPFDLGNFRTIKIDTSDKYKMVRDLDTLRSEIATSIQRTLADGESRDNPILTFCPSAKFTVDDSW